MTLIKYIEILFCYENNSHNHGQFLLLILTIPLSERSLQMNLYNLHILLTFHVGLQLQFSCALEGQCFSISKYGMYSVLPIEYSVHICMATQGYICMMKQA